MSAKIEDIDPQVVYVGEWFRDNFTSASGGSRHGAALSGVTVTLEFRGTSIQVVGMLDDSPHFGLPVTAYDIDGQHITTVHAPWSDSRQFNYVHFEKTDLSPGDHTLIVTNMNGTSPTIFWLDYFLVDSSSLSSAVPPTVPTSHGSLPSSQRPQSSSPSPNPPTTGSSSPPESTSSASRSVSSSTSTSTSTSPSPNTESGPSSSNSSSSLIPVDSQKPGSSSLSSTSSQPISTSVESAASTSTSSNSGIIGGVVGGIASIALIAFILFFWRRHRLKREADQLRQIAQETSSFTGTAFTSSHPHRHHCCCSHSCQHTSTHHTSRPSRSHASSGRSYLLGSHTTGSSRSVTISTERSVSRGRSSRPRRSHRSPSQETGISRYTGYTGTGMEASLPGSPLPASPPALPTHRPTNPFSRFSLNTSEMAELPRRPSSPARTATSARPLSSSSTTPGPGTLLRTEATQAPWYAPPEVQQSAAELLDAVAARRGTRDARRRDLPAPPEAAAEEMDSGLRLYSDDTLPPRYTAE